MLSIESGFNSLNIGNGGPISFELEQNKKLYNSMEPILQEIQKTIALPKDQKSYHNTVIHKVVDSIIDEMKRVDPLFNILFNKKLFGGSYFDGLKLHSPDEYDLDLALKFNSKLNVKIEKSDITGFVRIRIDLDAMEKEPNSKDYRAMEKMVDSSNYLIPSSFRAWFEGVFNKAKNNMLLNGNGPKFSSSKSGPAITVVTEIGGKKVCMDLVPAIIFSKKTDWPPAPFRSNPITNKDEFLVVPKDPPGSRKNNNSWRLSFQEQEKMIIIGKNGLKDTIRLIKLLRTRQFKETVLASYYIKTVMMWFEDSVDDSFWKNSRSYIFMMGLKYFSKALKDKKIPYYWNREYNLIMAVGDVTIVNWSNRLDRIIANLEKKISSSTDDLRNYLYEIFGLDLNKNGVQNQQGGSGQIRDEEDQTLLLTAENMDGCDSGSSGEPAPCEKNIDRQIDASMWKCFSEFEAVGINVTRKLEKMDRVQAIHAEKLISDILKMGLLDRLTDDTNINGGNISKLLRKVNVWDFPELNEYGENILGLPC